MAAVFTKIISFFTLVAALFSGIFGQYAKQEKHAIFIGHRGYSGLYQENTEEAFRMAGIKGFGGCETDVRVTSDGVLVLCHNSDMDLCGTVFECANTLRAIGTVLIISPIRLSNP